VAPQQLLTYVMSEPAKAAYDRIVSRSSDCISAGPFMKKVDERTAANMEVALEQTCRVLPQGGDHETRKRIAKKLLHCARDGMSNLSDFMKVARSALRESSYRKSA
jgi:hypothetical protein